MDLALLLQEMGIESDRQKLHTEWAVKELKRHPYLKPVATLHKDGRHRYRHPVIEALGPEWFEERSLSAREAIRRDQQCAKCKGRSPLKILARCGGCGMTYYCSKECQKADWPMHKSRCKSTAQFVTHWQSGDGIKISRAIIHKRALFLEWFRTPQYAHHQALIFALGLHRDPSRGRTHIVLRRIERVPNNHARMDIRSRFRVAQCSVCRTEDILSDIETWCMKGLSGKDAETGEAALVETDPEEPFDDPQFQ